MNISPDNIYGDCKLKCVYSFNYPTSNCYATNKKYYIRIAYDTTSVPAVKFNNSSFNVSEIFIVSPSIHKFNGSNVEAELIIIHSPIAGGYELCVCVPILSGGGSSTSSKIIETIISTVVNQAPAEGESAVIKIDDFTLNSIVPTEPFYSYSVGDKEQFIVYGIKYAIYISQDAVKNLQSIISPLTENVLPVDADLFATINPKDGKSIPLFINTSGPTGEISDGQIYIDCRPTGASEETTEIAKTKPAIKMNITPESLLQNPIVIFIISSLFALIILYLTYFLINFASSGTTSIKLPSFSKNKS
jgi:hypothetical protein